MVTRSILTGCMAVICMVIGNAQKDITSLFPQKWKTPVGITTYRTNMILNDGLIYIGSNGDDTESSFDDKDGVFALDAKTGKLVHHYEIPFGGNNDVTGIAIGDGKLFFGTDNYYFFCFDLKTRQELWKYHLPYDVESCPVLEDFNGDKVLDVAFSVQGRGHYALDGVTGELIWLNEEISSHSGNVSPALYDLNGDGVKDVISGGRGEPNSDELAGFKMRHYGDYHFALDGKTGKYLWVVETGAGIHASPFVRKTAEGVEIYLLDCYGELNIVNQHGKVLKYAGVDYGIHSSPVVSADNHLVVRNMTIEVDQKYFDRENDTLPYYLSERAANKMLTVESDFTDVVTATTMIADVLGKGFMQLIGVTETGMLFIAKTDGTILHQVKIPKGAEASLLIRNIDGDGKLEILLASLDGYLYCYDTPSKGKVEHGSFR